MEVSQSVDQSMTVVSQHDNSGNPPPEDGSDWPDKDPTPVDLPAPAVSQSSATSEDRCDPVPAAVSLPDFTLDQSKIFLDICAGSTRPLSSAILARSGAVLSFDILLNSEMDILQDSSYEQLLRICASGQVQYGAASPSCAHYSRLKLAPGPGPRALRTPDALDGIPGLSGHELLQVQESFMMLFRCVTCLTLVYQAGGHVHLEQPPSAMSWLEPCVQQFLILIAAYCTVISACEYGKDWYKQWMFAASWQPISSLGKLCSHAAGSHASIRGVRTDSGEYLSRQTACYPQALAEAFASLVAPLVYHDPPWDIHWTDRHSLLPKKDIFSPPFGQEDGGGFHSNPDWSMGHRPQPDSFAALRKTWMERIVAQRLDLYMLEFFNSVDHSNPPFSDAVLAPFRGDLEKFLTDAGISPNWDIREHQPMCLHILHALSGIMEDPDTSLFPALLHGVPTGYQKDIPLSHCFPLNHNDDVADVPLSAHLSNWQSAEDDLALTQESVNQEIQKGWVFPFDGTLEDAQQQFPLGVSLGKLGIAYSEGRAPRLVLDNSVCGLNARCSIPERSTLPSIKDILRTFPLRNFSGDHLGFSLDIKAAHKRIFIRETEHGLLGFSLGGKLYFYRVAPFGATFSASWWSRVGGYLLRLFHRIIWLIHVGLLYVDDFFFSQAAKAMPISAAMLCILCQLTQIPVSWAKCDFLEQFSGLAGRSTSVQVLLKSLQQKSANCAATCKPC